MSDGVTTEAGRALDELPYIANGVGSKKPSDLWAVKARKSYVCSGCRVGIAVGEIYIRRYEEYGRPIKTSCWCLACSRVKFSCELVFDLDPALRFGTLPV